jgi:uncharacterized protein (DUF2132 family)
VTWAQHYERRHVHSLSRIEHTLNDTMSESRHPDSDPLQGVTLKAMVEHLVERYGWDGLGDRITIRCFTHDPSVNSSLKFLRKTPWARAKVESLYLHSVAHPRKSATPASGEHTR